MAETAEAQVEGTETTAEQTPAPTTTEQTPATTDSSAAAEHMATVLAAVEANPALAEDSDIKPILELAGKAPKAEGGKTETKAEETKTEETKTEETKTEAGKTEETKTEETKTEETKTEETKTEETKTEETKTEETKEKSDSVFFKEEGGTEKVELKDLDAFNSHIKKEFGIENPAKFFSSVGTWRTQAQNAEKAETELRNINDSFAKMPEPLFNAYTAWANGQPWEKAVQGVGVLDFGKAFNEYDSHTIVNHYLPGDFTREDFTGENKDSNTVKQAISLAKSRYETDKQAVEGQRATYLEEAETSKELIKTSSASSVENLTQAFPGMGKTELNKVKSIMAGGDLTGLFFDKEGGYVKDAAEKIAYMLYAKDDIADANKRSKSSQDALIDKVDAGNEKPSTKTSTQSAKSAVPEGVSTLYNDLVEKKVY